MARLIVLLPHGQRLVYDVEQSTTIGRHADNTISIPEPHISKAHCRITAHEKGFLLEDLGSTNGTNLDGIRITAPVSLNNGARISLGGTECIFLLEDRRAAPVSPDAASPRASDDHHESLQLPTAPPLPAAAQKPDSQHVMQAVFTPKQPGMVQGRIAVESKTFQPEKEITIVEDLRRDYEKLRIANELMQTVGHEIDLDRILDRILECIFTMLPANRGVVLLYEASGRPLPRATRMRKERPD
ncbi:MAG TPA: FHA domain-containing protein, partial [Candidatus Ozemobacteraceae bacterium]|nr:FHA domain-containing protein [Candidatus Ozemobacteraceae bacterium]